MADKYTAQEIETMRVELAKRDSKILKETDIFALVYHGCSSYKAMHIDKIVKHYKAWKDTD